MEIGHVIRDKPIVGCAKEREVKISLDGVYEVRAAGSVRAEVECGCGEDEGL